MNRIAPAALLLCLAAVRCVTAAEPAVPPSAAAPPAPVVAAAITRALPVIRDRGVEWIEQRSCVSCHRVSFMTWALRAAAENGFEVDRKQLTTWEQWSVEALLKPQEGRTEPAGASNLEGVAQVLWAARNQPDHPSTAARQQLLAFLLEAQEDSGTWPAKGQLPRQKRPPEETALVSSLWNALALGTAGNTAETAEARKRALAGAGPYREAASTEWYVVRLLLAVQSAAPGDRQQLIDRLTALQRPGGGWGWLVKDEADALATGMALYALRFADVPVEHDSIRQGVQFLLNTQQDDGSWQVPGTKRQARGLPVETAGYWGTCWATIGLLSTRTMPPPAGESAPAATPDG